MQITKKIGENLYYVGASDRRLELFENMFPLKSGVSYNSYVLKDEKTVLFDTADAAVLKQFMENVEFVLEDRKLDYLIVNHMEPDHAATIEEVVLRYPQVQIVGNQKTFTLMKQFFKCNFNQYLVKEGDVLNTGDHSLTFVMAPMVHWPEVMVTYDANSKTLFSADAFGTFGALDGRLFADEYNFDRDWLDEARRYFTNIVGKYGAQAAAALDKAATLEINMVCPLHGPIWRDDIKYFMDKQYLWSKYEPENPDEVLIAYASMYGNTESVVNAAAMKISEKGRKVRVINTCNTDKSYLIAEMFRVGTIIIACPTYNGGIYPALETLVLDMKSLNLQNRRMFVIENGSWAPTVARKVSEVMDSMKGMKVQRVLSFKSSLQNEKLLDDFVDAVVKE